ncbi:MAG: glycosyltransferase [Kouleothrix sp.]|nr:glycosyltransferase [Kouleothrix sp.]
MQQTRQRLSIFIPSMRIGGAERAMLNLACGLADRGYAVDLVLAQAEGPYLSDIPESVRLVDLKASRVLTSLPALVRYLRRERPAAMLASWEHANIIALWARYLAGTAMHLVLNEQNTLSSSTQQEASRQGRLIPRLAKQFYPWADGFVAVSQGVADDLAEVTRIPRESIRVIYNPIVTPDLRDKMRAPLEHPWFAPGQPPVVVAVGRLRPQKDFPTLLQAFARVRAERPARLLILGEGTERPALESLVKQLGLEQDVGLPGFVKNPYAYLSRAALFALSSRWEGLPTVLIEALYCGAPVVSTDCPSGPREILAGGAYGPLVPVGDVAALARAMALALDGKTPRASEESWQRFEMGTMVEQYVNVLLGA